MSFLIDIRVTNGRFETHLICDIDYHLMPYKKDEVKRILLSSFQQRMDIQQMIGTLLDIKIDQIIQIESRSEIPDEPF